jgi:hypothetical protein
MSGRPAKLNSRCPYVFLPTPAEERNRLCCQKQARAGCRVGVVLPHGKILPKVIRCLIVGSYRQRPEQVLQLVDMAQQGGRVEVQVELL